MFCQKCGNPLQPNESFCTKCGAPNNQQPQGGFQQGGFQQPRAGYQGGYAPKATPNLGLTSILRLVTAFLFLLEYVFWFVKSDGRSMAFFTSTMWSVLIAIGFSVAAAALAGKAFGIKVPGGINLDKVAIFFAAFLGYHSYNLTAGGGSLPATMVLFVIVLFIIIALLAVTSFLGGKEKK